MQDTYLTTIAPIQGSLYKKYPTHPQLPGIKADLWDFIGGGGGEHEKEDGKKGEKRIRNSEKEKMLRN